MFRTSYVHYQEHYIVHAAVYGLFSRLLCSPSTWFAYDEVYVVSVCLSPTQGLTLFLTITL